MALKGYFPEFEQLSTILKGNCSDVIGHLSGIFWAITMKSLDVIVSNFLCVVTYFRVHTKIPGRFKCTIWSNNIGGVGHIFLQFSSKTTEMWSNARRNIFTPKLSMVFFYCIFIKARGKRHLRRNGSSSMASFALIEAACRNPLNVELICALPLAAHSSI